jgi:hypothetical protein
MICPKVAELIIRLADSKTFSSICCPDNLGISAPSLNTTVTTDSPNLEIDLSSIISGILATAISIGEVIKLSTSYTARDGAIEMTCTWLLVISGIASIGEWNREYMPHPINAAMNRHIMNSFFMENLMIRSIILIQLILIQSSAGILCSG